MSSNSSITGVVTDAGTSLAIAGVQVGTNPASVTATTDSGGTYTLNVTAGTYDVLFTMSGYNANFVGAVVAPVNGTVTANVLLTKVPTNAAQDLFSRPDQSGIGTASDGHTWSNDLNVFPLATTSIASQRFFVQTATAFTDHDTWMGIAYRDQEVTADMSMVSVVQDPNAQHGGRVLARVLGNDRWIVLTLNPTNSTLTIWIDSSANWTQIGSVAHSFSTNTWYHAKIDVIGTVAYGKAWAFGTTEPAWQVTGPGIVPALMSAGVGGLRVGAADVYFANYLEIPITQISGTVTDAATGVVLSGINVTLSNGSNTTTSSEGRYVFSGLAPGTYTVSAAPPHYNAGSTNATVSTGLGALGTNLALVPTYAAGAVGTDTGLWVLHGGSTGFTGDGGVLLGAPAVVAIPQVSGPASPLYIATGSDHALWVRNDTQGWQRFAGGPTNCVDNPAGAVNAGTLYIACEGGQDHALWHAETPAPTGTNLPTLNPNSWQSLGGTLVAGPAVGIVAGTLTYLVVGTDQHIYSRTLSTGFTRFAWAACIGHPALATSGSTAYFACHGTDDALWYATNTGSGWSAPQSLGGTLVDGVGVAATSTGPLFFVEGVGGVVYHRSISLGWTTDGGQVQFGIGASAL